MHQVVENGLNAWLRDSTNCRESASKNIPI